MMSQTEILTWSFAFGTVGGAFMVAMIYYWLWGQLHPSKFDMEWVKSEVKDLRKELESECYKRQCVEDRVHAIEKPPFEPKFGDWVSTTYQGGKVKAVYLAKLRDGQHRVVADINGTTEFYADKVEPLDD